MITVFLYGKLGDKFGREWHLNVPSPAHALHHIDAMKGGLFDLIYDMEKEVQGYHVQVSEETIGEERLAFPCLGGEVVKITPLLQGTDSKGVIQIVAGVALIALGVVIGVGTFGAGLPAYGLSAAAIGFQVGLLGAAVALGGIARLMMSTPGQTVGSEDKTRSSYVFSGPVNTIQQGECVPICYGQPIIGSAVVSAGMEAVDVT